MLEALIGLTTRRPRWVLVIALAAVVGAVFLGSNVTDRLRAGQGTEDPASESARAGAVLEEHFPDSRPNLLLLVEAETAAVSFGGADGLFLTGWAAVGITNDTNRRFLTAYETCLKGGEPHSEPGDPRGYVHVDATLDDFVEGGLGPDAAPDVVAAVEEQWGPNPCGAMVSEPMAILHDLGLVGEIDVPVHLVFGSLDVLRQGVEGYPGLFASSPEVTVTTLENAGHFVTVDEGSERVYDAAAAWMEQHAHTS